MRTVNLSSISPEERAALMKRNAVQFDDIRDSVSHIITQVKNGGDVAVQQFTEKFDGVRPDELMMDVPEPDEINLPENVKNAFETAFRNIMRFHIPQKPVRIRVETMPGVFCARESRPIESVGLYVPGGTAVLPSTVLMLGIPALIAGCPNILLATPPRKDGSVAPEVLFCASLCGIKNILKAGGAQAVAAMAYGTETVPKVDKIFGPGNQYVTCAKMLLQNSDALISIDMPAGPSEVLVIADKFAEPEFIAADLLSQAEHGADSQAVLVTTSSELIPLVQAEVQRQLNELPRADVTKLALENSVIILADSLEEAFRFSNEWAPEHLIISIKNSRKWKSKITNAGSVFLGKWSPESVGDYASGTNHTLPTSGYARMFSGVSVDSFVKQITFQELTPDGLRELGPDVEIMANSEGLDAHRLAVTRRLNALKNEGGGDA